MVLEIDKNVGVAIDADTMSNCHGSRSVGEKGPCIGFLESIANATRKAAINTTKTQTATAFSLRTARRLGFQSC